MSPPRIVYRFGRHDLLRTRFAISPLIELAAATYVVRLPSTFPEHRPWILGRYREALYRRGWRLPDDSTLDLLFETAEYARYACCVAGPALAASRAERWGFEQLAEVESWFARLEPVLGAAGGR